MPSLSLAELPPIVSDRLRLRPLGQADAEALREMTDEPTILAAVDILRAPFTLAEAERLIRGHSDGADCFFGVWPRDGDQLIGVVGAHRHGCDQIEIGYWFASAARGRGLAREAVAAVIGALERAFPDRRLVAECRPQNEASWRLLERIGFRADGAEGARPGRKRLVLVGPG
jgi:RimJ/RimL family protein N-acetyltransferase